MSESITFHCPKCNNLCGFKKEHAGKIAICVNCQTKFFIPDRDGQRPRKYNPEDKGPEPGFFENVFTSNLSAFVNKDSVLGLIFVAAAVCFEFFMANEDWSMPLPGFTVLMPIGLITLIITRGILFWYYGQVINWAAMEIACLPDISIGSGFEFIWNVIKDTYMFVVSIILSIMPFAIIASVVEIFTGELNSIIKLIMFCMGLLLCPLMLITIFAGRQISMIFRVDYVFRPLFKAFLPYLFVSVLTLIAGVSQVLIYFSSIGGYWELQKDGMWKVILFLIANLAATALTIFAMRTIGLFCRHYRVFMPHIWAQNDLVKRVS